MQNYTWVIIFVVYLGRRRGGAEGRSAATKLQATKEALFSAVLAVCPRLCLVVYVQQYWQ